MLNKRKREACPHNVYIKGLCGNCGIRLDPPQSSSVSMIHSVPELKVSKEYAKEIGKADQERLIQERKLVLLVDLDQTILHTTHEKVKNHSKVHSFMLWPGHPTYYTKLRPHLEEFLEQMFKIYELHIFTFGCRMYAHKIASIIDPKQKYFGNRILSRDESVDQYSKRGNLNNLFPCGDAMVCIIDDRADVWRDAGNLIQVKPYSYFKTSISDGAMMSANSSSAAAAAEDDASLDADVDELEALLGVDKDDEEQKGDGPSNDDLGKQKEIIEGAKDKQQNDTQDDATKSDDDKDPKEQQLAPDAEQNCELDSKKTKMEAEDATRRVNMRVPVPEDNRQTSGEVTGGSIEKPSTSDDVDDEASSDSAASLSDNDLDDHLLHLPTILKRIHEKWYMELDEQRQFLVDGESYKLPDIKEIIRRYLRKRY